MIRPHRVPHPHDRLLRSNTAAGQRRSFYCRSRLELKRFRAPWGSGHRGGSSRLADWRHEWSPHRAPAYTACSRKAEHPRHPRHHHQQIDNCTQSSHSGKPKDRYQPLGEGLDMLTCPETAPAASAANTRICHEPVTSRQFLLFSLVARRAPRASRSPRRSSRSRAAPPPCVPPAAAPACERDRGFRRTWVPRRSGGSCRTPGGRAL